MDDEYQLDKENGNNYFAVAIPKEMKKVRVTFNILHGDEKIPHAYKFMQCHMIFDIKINNFKRKARYVSEGPLTEPPYYITYARFFSRESVRIILTISAPNNLHAFTSEVKNEYFQGPVTQKIWTTCGPEFEAASGKKYIIVCALYWINSSGYIFIKHIAQFISELGHCSWKSDRDVCISECTKPNGTYFYEYVLLYVEDIYA